LHNSGAANGTTVAIAATVSEHVAEKRAWLHETRATPTLTETLHTSQQSVCQCCASVSVTAGSSPVSIQTQSLALRALRKRKPQETQALTLANSQSWLPLLRPSIPIGWRLRLNGNRA